VPAVSTEKAWILAKGSEVMLAYEWGACRADHG